MFHDEGKITDQVEPKGIDTNEEINWFGTYCPYLLNSHVTSFRLRIAAGLIICLFSSCTGYKAVTTADPSQKIRSRKTIKVTVQNRDSDRIKYYLISMDSVQLIGLEALHDQGGNQIKTVDIRHAKIQKNTVRIILKKEGRINKLDIRTMSSEKITGLQHGVDGQGQSFVRERSIAVEDVKSIKQKKLSVVKSIGLGLVLYFSFFFFTDFGD